MSKLLLLVTFIVSCHAWHSSRLSQSRTRVQSKGLSIRPGNVFSSAIDVSSHSRQRRGLTATSDDSSPIEEIEEEESAFEKVASMGLAGVLAIAVAESIFWALGVPLAELYYKYTTGEWIDIMTTDGQLKAAGFSFGYGGFATVILQYRVTLFAIPLVPLMQKLVVDPGKKMFGESWGEKTEDDVTNQGKLYSQASYTIIGATSGVGQCIAAAINDTGANNKVKAVTRNIDSASEFDMLEGCEFVEADAREPSSLPAALERTDFLVICVGTTAFPTKKWQNGQNKPKTACLDSVVNILDAIKAMDKGKKPKKIVLISSIGVERRNVLPFSILNSFGVLDYKYKSEQVLRQFSAETGIPSIVVRPGRLVGAPFTNTDLAALMELDQGNKRGIAVSREDDIAGDTERKDVATVVLQALEVPTSVQHAVFSLVNENGSAPTGEGLSELLSKVMIGEASQVVADAE